MGEKINKINAASERFPLWQRIMVALVLGVIVGMLLKDKAQWLAPIGSMFINAIRMIVIPVVFTSIVCSIIGMADLKVMGRVTGKAMAFYVATMMIATIIGIGLALWIQPGVGVSPNIIPVDHGIFQNLQVVQKEFSLIDTIINMIPPNPVMAFAEGEVLPTIVFATFLGVAILKVGKPAEPIANVFQSFSAVMFQTVKFVLFFTPLGVFALMAYMVSLMGLQVLLELGKLVLTVYIGCLLHAFIVYPVLLRGLARVSPLQFFKKMISVMSFAFATGSSLATLPLNMQTAENRLGIDKTIGEFLLPLGATVNMNGLSVYLGVIALFVANMFNVELSFFQYVVIVFTSTLASIGCAGVPMSAIVVMSLVLNAIGLPVEAIALIATVDRIIEMITTTLNVTGDTVIAAVVSRQENKLDDAMFNDNAV